jgi:hypothetical protein
LSVVLKRRHLHAVALGRGEADDEAEDEEQNPHPVMLPQWPRPAGENRHVATLLATLLPKPAVEARSAFNVSLCTFGLKTFMRPWS